jgi:hypothetical protein
MVKNEDLSHVKETAAYAHHFRKNSQNLKCSNSYLKSITTHNTG